MDNPNCDNTLFYLNIMFRRIIKLLTIFSIFPKMVQNDEKNIKSQHDLGFV